MSISLEIIPVGDELGVVLPDQILARLGLRQGEYALFSMTADDSILLIAPDAAQLAQLLAEEGGGGSTDENLRDISG